jgi:hypothetical protein
MPRYLRAPTKDPDEKWSLTIDWSDRLSSDTISSSSWSYTGSPDTTPLVLSGSANTTTTASIVADDGTEGTEYSLLNRVVSAAGYTFDQTVLMKCRTR